GGKAPYTWSVGGGTLPSGVTLSPGGVLSGIPTVSGSFGFAPLVKDSTPGAPHSTYKPLTLKVIVPPIAITTASPLPRVTQGHSYNQTLSFAGGTAPITWSVAGGALPPGMTLSPGGVLAGTPTAYGSFFFTLQIKDSKPGGALTATKAFTLAVAVAPLAIT